jgi:hypothetical protein
MQGLPPGCTPLLPPQRCIAVAAAAAAVARADMYKSCQVHDKFSLFVNALK